MPKLYKVDYAFSVLVVADDTASARVRANGEARDEFASRSAWDCQAGCREITEPGQIPDDWRAGRPYVDDDVLDRDGNELMNLTAPQWFARIKAEARARAAAGPAAGQGELGIGEVESEMKGPAK